MIYFDLVWLCIHLNLCHVHVPLKSSHLIFVHLYALVVGGEGVSFQLIKKTKRGLQFEILAL